LHPTRANAAISNALPAIAPSVEGLARPAISDREAEILFHD
jgi:hypothetical protein